MLNLGTALYAHSETVELTGGKIGKTGIVGLATSEHRKGESQAPKLSAAATALDVILKHPKTVAVYDSTVDSAIYCEFDGIMAVATGSSVRYSADLTKGAHLVIPDVLFELSKYGKNEELKRVFSEICKEYETKGCVNEQSVYLFCDSYYYGCAKEKSGIDTANTLEESEVIAAFRASTFQRDELIYGKAGKYVKVSDRESGSVVVEKKKTTTKKTDFMQECKEGKYKIAYEWPDFMKKFIVDRKHLDTFVPTPEFEEIVKKIYYRANKILERMEMGYTGAEAIGKDALNIMLLGKPGTGKTALAHALSAATGMPVCTTAWNKHSDEDEEEGKTKIVEGKPTFVETNALLFHQYGGIDINEEINLADPSVTMGSLGQKLEFPYIVKKNGYETVVRHPLNVVIGTMNVGTNGSNPLNQALANRFKTPYILDDPTKETFIDILMKASGKGLDVCTWVYNAYEATVQYLKDPDVNEEEICQNLSIRTCMGAIENMEEGQTPTRALINSIVGAVAIVDLEVARNLQREKIECLPNPTFKL